MEQRNIGDFTTHRANGLVQDFLNAVRDGTVQNFWQREAIGAFSTEGVLGCRDQDRSVLTLHVVDVASDVALHREQGREVLGFVVHHGPIEGQQLNHRGTVIGEAPNAWVRAEGDFNALWLCFIDTVQTAVTISIDAEVATDVAVEGLTTRVPGNHSFRVGSAISGVRLHGDVTQTAWVGRNLEVLTGQTLQGTCGTGNLSSRGGSATKPSRVCTSTINTQVVGVGRLDGREEIAVTSGDDVVTPSGGVHRSAVVGFGVAVGLTGTGWRQTTNDEHAVFGTIIIAATCTSRRDTFLASVSSSHHGDDAFTERQLRDGDDGFVFSTTCVDTGGVVCRTNHITWSKFRNRAEPCGHFPVAIFT